MNNDMEIYEDGILIDTIPRTAGRYFMTDLYYYYKKKYSDEADFIAFMRIPLTNLKVKN